MRWQTLYEARWILAVLIVPLGLGLSFRQYWLTALGALALVFVINFFRDPDRPIPAGDDVVVSAADGVVSDIIEKEEAEVTKKPSVRVGVFLSVFDVHVNRAPVAGKIVHSVRHEGHFYDARDPRASEMNEARTWGFENPKAGVVVVRQITGLIARRIVDWAKVGDTMQKGERFGMIRFGSRTEVFLPLGSEILVKVGDRVKGGETVIARLK